jgi:glycosyltransferase involved in cell wall biosynthesis
MIRILTLSSDTDGVGYHRTLMPHLCLRDPEIRIENRLLFDTTIPLNNEEWMKQFNILFYNKVIPFQTEQQEDAFFNMLRKNNIKVVYDLDDYFILNSSHINYRNWKSNNSQAKVEKLMRGADMVTTTTPIFADIIKEYNPNVTVLPNAVNLNEQQWIHKTPKSDKLRFIWGGGISHRVDLNIIKDSFKKFDKDFINTCQFYMCGYDLRVRMGDGATLKDDPNRSAWTFFEDIFTNSDRYVKNPKYLQFLRTYDKADFGYREEFKDEYYQRRWTKCIVEYGTMYNEADVAIAPLKNNHMFNYCKSQLKVVEAGAHGLPLICSNYGPYTIDDIEGKKDGKRKGFLVDESKGDWSEKMMWYSKNRDAVKEHGQNMREYVEKNYSIEVVSKQRAELYKKLANS